MQNVLISLEGVDACGKNTQSKKLEQHFIDRGDMVTRFELPDYDSVTGQMLLGFLTGKWSAALSVASREGLKGQYLDDIPGYVFHCVMIANRLETLPNDLWGPPTGRVFIADRYSASADAYGLALGIPLEFSRKLYRNIPSADLNILLDITLEESLKRRPDRRDNYEKNFDMLKRVRGHYQDIFSTPDPSYVIVDASGTHDETFAQILSALESINDLI